MFTNSLRSVLIISFFCVFAINLRAQESVQLYIADFPNHELRMKIEESGTELLNAFNIAVQEEKLPVFLDTPTFLERRLLEMWDTAPMYVPGNTIVLTLNKLSNGLFEVRGIPLVLLDDGIRNSEEGIILFNQNGNVEDFRLSLPMHQYATLLEKGQDDIDINRRKEIISFTEDLKTAYNRKDLGFIKNIFSDQALVIVGHVTQVSDSSSPYEKQVEYLRFTKQEYVQRLEKVFEANEFIDVNFDKINISRHNIYKDVYGVNLNQYYKSSTYQDEGYLFLLVDFKDPDKPMIHVRVWQPLQETEESNLFTMGEIELF